MIKPVILVSCDWPVISIFILLHL